MIQTVKNEGVRDGNGSTTACRGSPAQRDRLTDGNRPGAVPELGSVRDG